MEIFYKKTPVIFLVFLLFLPTGYGKSKRHRTDQQWKNRKRECEKVTCAHIQFEVNDNCVNSCVDDACFREIYSEAEGGVLEDGEIDSGRYRLFIACVRKGVRERKRASSEKKRQETEKKKRAARGEVEQVSEEQVSEEQVAVEQGTEREEEDEVVDLMDRY